MDNERIFTDFYMWVAEKIGGNYVIEGNKVTIKIGGEKICKFYGKKKFIVHLLDGKVKVYKNWTILSFQRIMGILKNR